MSTDVLRFEIGTVTEFETPDGRRYLRGDLDGLRLTFIEEPDREPAPGGRACYSVWVSPAPFRARHVRGPAHEARGTTPGVVKISKARSAEARAFEVLERIGRLPLGGDELPEFRTASDDDALQGAIALLETPVV